MTGHTLTGARDANANTGVRRHIPRKVFCDVYMIVHDIAIRHGVAYGDIFSPKKHHDIYAARVEAVKAVHLSFPWLSSVQLGQIFCRDHATILNMSHKRNRSG